MTVFKRQLLLEGPIFHFHNYWRNGKSTAKDIFVKYLEVYIWSGFIWFHYH